MDGGFNWRGVNWRGVKWRGVKWRGFQLAGPTVVLLLHIYILEHHRKW